MPFMMSLSLMEVCWSLFSARCPYPRRGTARKRVRPLSRGPLTSSWAEQSSHVAGGAPSKSSRLPAPPERWTQRCSLFGPPPAIPSATCTTPLSLSSCPSKYLSLQRVPAWPRGVVVHSDTHREGCLVSRPSPRSRPQPQLRAHRALGGVDRLLVRARMVRTNVPAHHPGC